jgi:hypothetical protein
MSPDPPLPKYDVESPEPLTTTTPTIMAHPRPLTPDSRTFPSGSSTPLHVEVNPDDVAMRRVHSPPRLPLNVQPPQVDCREAGDEWTWDEAGEEWDTKRSLDALRPHHD